MPRKETLAVRVRPGAREDRIVETPNGLVVEVKARAIDGRANEAVIRVLAAHFGVSRTAVVIKTPRGRKKLVVIER